MGLSSGLSGNGGTGLPVFYDAQTGLVFVTTPAGLGLGGIVRAPGGAPIAPITHGRESIVLPTPDADRRTRP